VAFQLKQESSNNLFLSTLKETADIISYVVWSRH